MKSSSRNNWNACTSGPKPFYGDGRSELAPLEGTQGTGKCGRRALSALVPRAENNVTGRAQEGSGVLVQAEGGRAAVRVCSCDDVVKADECVSRSASTFRGTEEGTERECC